MVQSKGEGEIIELDTILEYRDGQVFIKKMKGVRCCMKMANTKIIETIWKTERQFLKVLFVKY